jgi:O-methyltransferase
MEIFKKALRKLPSILLALPYVFAFVASPEIGAHYGVGPLRKLRLVVTFSLNKRRVETLSSIVEHLELASTLLRIPPTVEGAVVECGCYKGGSTINISLVCEIVGRRLIVCDSFQGLPEVREYDANHVSPSHASLGHTEPYSEGALAAPLDLVKSNLTRYGSVELCEFKVGFFDESLKDFDAAVAMAFLDVDLIDSLRPCLTALWPGLVRDGRIYVHEADDLPLVATFFDRAWWGEQIGGDAPGFVGAGTGLPLAALRGSNLGYTEKAETAIFGVPD